jgi:hypothetical protein
MYVKHVKVIEEGVKGKFQQKNVFLLVFTSTDIRDIWCTELSVVLVQSVACSML